MITTERACFILMSVLWLFSWLSSWYWYYKCCQLKIKVCKQEEDQGGGGIETIWGKL